MTCEPASGAGGGFRFGTARKRCGSEAKIVQGRKALRTRAKKQRAARKPHLSEITAGGSIIENIAQTKRLAETQLDGSTRSGSKILPDEERPTNTASGSNEEDDENAG
uniref:Uncharacterized protein n=1 Tax=Anopheles maculatus TaxID=74869 RepID=A0A182SXA6_9DIPT